jgi:hypothetical protein
MVVVVVVMGVMMSLIVHIVFVLLLVLLFDHVIAQKVSLLQRRRLVQEELVRLLQIVKLGAVEFGDLLTLLVERSAELLGGSMSLPTRRREYGRRLGMLLCGEVGRVEWRRWKELLQRVVAGKGDQQPVSRTPRDLCNVSVGYGVTR